MFLMGLEFYLQVAGKSMDVVSSVEQMIVMDEHAIHLEVKKQEIRRKTENGDPTQAAAV